MTEASGGKISPPKHDDDLIHAILSPGYVIPKRVADQLGDMNVFRRLNEAPATHLEAE